MHHSMDQLDMLDPTGSMTTLAPISETPLTPTHQHLHGSYHSMNHMMSHHHPSGLSGHSTGTHLVQSYNGFYMHTTVLHHVVLNSHFFPNRTPWPFRGTSSCDNGSSSCGGSTSWHRYRSQRAWSVCREIQATKNKIGYFVIIDGSFLRSLYNSVPLQFRSHASRRWESTSEFKVTWSRGPLTKYNMPFRESHAVT